MTSGKCDIMKHMFPVKSLNESFCSRSCEMLLLYVFLIISAVLVVEFHAAY